MKLYSLLFLLFIFSVKTLHAQNSKTVTRFSDVPSGWIVIGSSGVGTDVRLTIADSKSYNTGDRVSVCYSINDQGNWKQVGYQESGCGQCYIPMAGGTAKSACFIYEKLTPRTTQSPPSNGNSTANAQVTQEQPRTPSGNGSLLPLLTCADIHEVEVFIKNKNNGVGSVSYGIFKLLRQYNDLIGKHVLFAEQEFWVPDVEKIYNKRISLPPGEYTLSAVENSGFLEPDLKVFVQDFTISPGKNDWMNMDFNYSHLYITPRTGVPSRHVLRERSLTINSTGNRYSLLVEINVDGKGPYKQFELNAGAIGINLCGAINPFVVSPGQHTLFVRLRKILPDGTESIIDGKVPIDMEKGKCLTYNLVVDQFLQ